MMRQVSSGLRVRIFRTVLACTLVLSQVVSAINIAPPRLLAADIADSNLVDSPSDVRFDPPNVQLENVMPESEIPPVVDVPADDGIIMGNPPPVFQNPPLDPPAVAVAPGILQVTPDRFLLAVGDLLTMALHVSIDPESAATYALQLSINIPPEFVVVDSINGERGDGTVTWKVGDVKEGAGFDAKVQLQLVGGKESDVYKFSTRLSAEGTESRVVETLVGVGSADAPVTVLLDPASKADGTSVEIAPFATASPTPVITQEPLGSDGLQPASEPFSDTASSNSIFLPVISSGSEAHQPVSPDSAANQAVQIDAADQVISEGTPLPDLSEEQLAEFIYRDERVNLYAGWQIEAVRNGEAVESLAQPATLLISAKQLAAKGIEAEHLQVVTRAGKDQPWELVDSYYDKNQELIVARVNHFSEWGAGQALQSFGQFLPSLRGASMDKFTGFANFSYPINAPAGLGGLNPGLSLSYSSGSAEDMANDAGTAYDVQSSWAGGLGWNLGGMSYIAKRHRFNNFSGEYYMVLNGMSVRIWKNGTQWMSDPNNLLKIEHCDEWYHVNGCTTNSSSKRKDVYGWTVTTPDGTKYYFGSDQFDANGEPLNNYTAMLFDVGCCHGWGDANGNVSARVGSKWYLRRVVDTSGNEMVYTYTRDTDYIGGECLNVYWDPGWRWYTRATYLATVEWSGNPGQGLARRMKVTLNKESRPDYQITKWNTNVTANRCVQPQFGSYRLKELITEVQRSDNSTWWQLNKTVIGYTASLQGNHSEIETIAHYGENTTTTPLYTYTIGYYNGGGNNVRMTSFDNGWGGKIIYTYQNQAIVCSGSCSRPANDHYAVIKTIAEDNLGNYYRNDYTYSTPRVYRACSTSDCEYVYQGHETVTAKTMTPSISSAGSTTMEKREKFVFIQHNGSYADTPLRGRLREYYVYLPADTNDANYLYHKYSNWAATPLTYGDWVYLDGEWEVTYGVTGAGAREGTGATTTRDFSYDSYGNMTQLIEYSGWPTGWPNPTGVTQQRKTVTNYAVNTTAWIVNKPGRVVVFNGSNSCLSEKRTLYDGAGSYSTAPTKGLPTRSEQPLTTCNITSNPTGLTDTAWDIDTIQYDAYGNVTTVTEHNQTRSYLPDASMITEYDSYYKLFVLRQYRGNNSTHAVYGRYWGVTDSSGTLSLSKDYAYWGNMAEYCEMNYVCTRQGYDDFGRITNRWEREIKGSAWDDTVVSTDANGNSLPGYYKEANTHWLYHEPGRFGTNHKTFIVTEFRSPRCYGNFVRSHYDGLGQLRQEQRPQQNWTVTRDGCTPGTAGEEIDVDYNYNGQGQQTQVSIPREGVRANFAARLLGSWSGVAQTQGFYDVLGRVYKTIAPNGETTQTTYKGRESYSIGIGRNGELNSNRVLQWQEVDPLGNLKYVKSGTVSGSTLTAANTVTLVHDALGNLTSSSNSASGAVTTITYDKAGRKTSMDDDDLGNWQYEYDRQGHLIRQTDARNSTTCLYYDTVDWGILGKEFASNSTSCPTTDPGWANYDVYYKYYDGTIQQNVGQLVQMGRRDSANNDLWKKDIAYLANGLVDYESVTQPGATGSPFKTTYTYDSYLRPLTTKYPDPGTSNEILTGYYNSMGLPAKLNSSVGGDLVDGTTTVVAGGSTTFTDAVDYDIEGRLKAMKLTQGGGLWRTQSYFGWTGSSDESNGRLSTIKVGTSNGASNKLSFEYQYDSFSNVNRIVERYDNSTTSYYTNTFTYDAQNRLTNGYSLPYSYDNAGRITQFEQSSTTHDYSVQQNTSHPHAPKWIKIPAGSSWSSNVRVRAYGTPYAGAYPQFKIRINDVDCGVTKTVTGSWAEYTATCAGMRSQSQVDIVFINDGSGGGEDRNLYIDWVIVNEGQEGSLTVQAEGATIIDKGAGNAAFDGKDIVAGQQGIYWNAALRFVSDAGNAGAVSMGYDNNGNMNYKLKHGVADVFTFDVENHLTEIKRNGTTNESYLYDADGNRVRKTVSSTHTYYPFPHYEVTGSAVTKYYFFGGQRVAMRAAGVLTYLHSDHLGSTALATNTSGGVHSSEQYYAYGKPNRLGAGTNLPTDNTYTGQKSDGSGLMYYNARYYDPAIGTFISADTIVPDATKVFDYQKYAYARLNPLKFNDPSGHVATCSMNANGDIQCGDVTVGIQTVVSNVNPLAPSCLSDCPKTVDQIIRETLEQLQGIENPFSITYDDDGMPSISVDQNKLTDALVAPLQTCAALIGGACGLSYGASVNGAGAGARISGSIYVDQSGNSGVFFDLGGGAYSPWLAPISKIAVTGIKDAKVQDIDGMSAQIGGSGALGPAGFATEGIFMKSDDGKVLRGQSSGYAFTAVPAAAEGHFTFVYSYPIVYINVND